MTIAVSVVVPVYNPGRYLDPLLRSLDRQSLPTERFETVFVDDGSTDGTAGLLDAWCADRENGHVIHQANHGWPGQPRNVGIAAARGTYIQFVDQDDWLGDEALERLTSYADVNGSDVVVGKMVGVDRRVPTALFRRSVPRAQIGVDRIEDSQTPHKMFRRAFLDRIGLRFPEDTRRLEDHLFVTAAYLRADVVSVYAETDCYFHTSRDDGRNAGFRSYDPVPYYAVVEEVIDLVEDHLPAGAARERYLSRWLRNELIGRLRSPIVRDLPTAERQVFYDEVSRIVRQRYAPTALRATTATVAVGAAIARHAPMSEFYRADDALHRIDVRAWEDDGGIGVALMDAGRTLTPETTLAAVLRAHLSPRIVEPVLADLGARAAERVVPDRITRISGTSRTVFTRDRVVFRAPDETARAGDRIRVASALGPRETTVTAERRRGGGGSAAVARLRRAARRLKDRTARLLPSRVRRVVRRRPRPR